MIIVIFVSIMNKSILLIVLVSCCFYSINSQVKYSSAWFGPNANPVPEVTGAIIPHNTEFTFRSDYSFNQGDKTLSTSLKIEIPLIAEKVSIKLWSDFFEYYKVSEEIKFSRNMIDGSGISTGDIYFQTRIKILSESKYKPAMIFNSTLKTASGSNFANRRFFDTPGYYFDLEFSKVFIIKSTIIDKIKFTGNTGFMCWETSGSQQNDAIMYALESSVFKKNLSLDIFLGGYDGWMYKHPAFGKDYGDSPFVFSLKLNYKSVDKTFYIKYLKGLNDFPYNQLSLGLTVPLKKLNPVFNNKNNE